MIGRSTPSVCALSSQSPLQSPIPRHEICAPTSAAQGLGKKNATRNDSNQPCNASRRLRQRLDHRDRGRRAPVAPEVVKLYTTAPSGAEVVGIVRASSGSGIGEQARMDYVINELKAQAGKIGASGVVLVASGARPAATAVVATGGGSFMALPSNRQEAQGRVFFVK